MTDPQIDIEQPGVLIDYLRHEGHLDPKEPAQAVLLTGGVSNRTMLVQRSESQTDWVVKQALARLRVKVDWFTDPARIEREALGIEHLAKLAPPGSTTPLVFIDLERHILAMHAVEQPHENWKDQLLRGEVETDAIRQFAVLLATIHRRATEQREQLYPVFEERRFFESLRLEPYYDYTAHHVHDARDFLRELIRETKSHRDTLVHGDYSPKNVLVHRSRLILIDHEVIHFGDGAFDLGFSFAHLLSKAHHLPDHRQTFADAARCYWQVYAETLGELSWTDALEPRVVRHTLGCLLARVAGRSPLEYLSEAERTHQAAVVIKRMQHPPMQMNDMIDTFVKAI